MTTSEMLVKLTNSKNELIAAKATEILLGARSAEEEIKYCGSFLRAVLEGNYEEAMRRADGDNRAALSA